MMTREQSVATIEFAAAFTDLCVDHYSNLGPGLKRWIEETLEAMQLGIKEAREGAEAVARAKKSGGGTN